MKDLPPINSLKISSLGPSGRYIKMFIFVYLRETCTSISHWLGPPQMKIRMLTLDVLGFTLATFAFLTTDSHFESQRRGSNGFTLRPSLFCATGLWAFMISFAVSWSLNNTTQWESQYHNKTLAVIHSEYHSTPSIKVIRWEASHRKIQWIPINEKE